MSLRDRYRQIADENAQIFDLGMYEAWDGTVVEVAAPAPSVLVKATPAIEGDGPTVGVAPEDSLTGAERLVREGLLRVAVLNFASARSPGGGYLRGGAAQEEDLCRRTSLYPALAAQTEFYEANSAWPDEVYTDQMLYTRGVMAIRDRQMALRPDPFAVDVITAPAPNLKAITEKGLAATLGRRVERALELRAERIVALAVEAGCDGLVLGAWGCGVFGNAASAVARAFQGALHTAPARVHFAVPDGADGNLAAFRAIFNA